MIDTRGDRNCSEDNNWNFYKPIKSKKKLSIFTNCLIVFKQNLPHLLLLPKMYCLQCFFNPEAAINYIIIPLRSTLFKKTIIVLNDCSPSPPHNHPPRILSPPPTLLTQSRGTYLCLDQASSLVSQVLQGSGNINLFSTCNRTKIGLSSKRRRNPAHICQSLFLLRSLWNSTPTENYYIHPSKDLEGGHWLFLDKICKKIKNNIYIYVYIFGTQVGAVFGERTIKSTTTPCFLCGSHIQKLV